MTGDLNIRTVLHQTTLRGSDSSNELQKVATVYIDGNEYRVYAPPAATGDALDWTKHLYVSQAAGFMGEETVLGSLRGFAIKVVQEELEKHKRDKNRAVGMHPDGIHCEAQICLKGHVQQCLGVVPFDSKAHCPICGAACIDECPHCKEPIRGIQKYGMRVEYSRPQFCHRCGRPYPWMEDRLQTARELLYHDDKLLEDDREAVLDLLRDVMADPKADLAPAKKTLIGIRLKNAAQPVREFVLDLLAKITVESLKP